MGETNMENSFARACTEVLEVLKYLPRDEYEKIPQYEIELLENQKDSSYEFALDSEEKYKKISKKANTIIIILWEKYFTNLNQKNKLYEILKQNSIREEEIKKQKYANKDIFKERKKEKMLVPVKKRKWYEKIYEFCKKVAKKIHKK